MAHSPDKKMKLRAAYIGGLPLEAAAEKAGVPYPTARNWYNAALKEGDDWNKYQAASLIVSGGGIEQAMGRIVAAGLLRCESLLERVSEVKDPAAAAEALASLGDTVSKLKSAAKTFMPDVSAEAAALDLVRALLAFVGEHAAAKGMIVADLLEAFAKARKLQIAAPLEELRARARAAGAAEPGKAAGLSDETAEQIRQKVLGINKK